MNQGGEKGGGGVQGEETFALS
eukprot:COSAG03_NODE_35653_length_116_cov_176.647059_1_plen_21_part_01